MKGVPGPSQPIPPRGDQQGVGQPMATQPSAPGMSPVGQGSMKSGGKSGSGQPMTVQPGASGIPATGQSQFQTMPKHGGQFGGGQPMTTQPGAFGMSPMGQGPSQTGKQNVQMMAQPGAGGMPPMGQGQFQGMPPQYGGQFGGGQPITTQPSAPGMPPIGQGSMKSGGKVAPGQPMMAQPGASGMPPMGQGQFQGMPPTGQGQFQGMPPMGQGQFQGMSPQYGGQFGGGQPMMMQPGAMGMPPGGQGPFQGMPQHGGQLGAGQPMSPMMMQGAAGMPPMGPGGQGTRLNMPFMPAPAPIPNCPPGLEYLSVVDHVFVNQCVEPIEIMTGIETPNAYQIFGNGGMMYWAQEFSDFSSRQCCGAGRPFKMVLTNQMGAPVMNFDRPYECCYQMLQVSAPPGRIIGTVHEDCACCMASFTCCDAAGAPIMRIRGPCCASMCGEAEFGVLTITGQPVGKVTKHWGGLLKEMLTDADQFGISFPPNLPVESKAVILGACILIDFMYFETSA